MNKRSLIFFLCLFAFYGCKKTEVDMDLKCRSVAGKGNDSEVTGKWKLVKVSTVFVNPTDFDFSCNRILYDFRSDGILVVSSDTEQSGLFRPGEYPYVFLRSPAYLGSTKGYTVRIAETSIPCTISRGIMTLSLAAVDGPVSYLIRI